MDIPHIIEKSFLLENKEKLGWNGTGSQNDPIIIDDVIKLPQNITFKTEDLHIHVNNVDIGVIILDKCRNIIIEDSIITVIRLRACKNIIIRNNILREIKLFLGNKNTIEENRTYTFSNIRYLTFTFLVISIIAGLTSIISYSFKFYLLGNIMFACLIFGVMLFYIELIKKRNKTFLPKKFKKNEFINLKEEIKPLDLDFEGEE